jgi:hypothetical protein
VVVYLFKTKCANKKLKIDADAPSLCNGKMVLKQQVNNSMQTEELIGPGDCHGHPQAYGVIHYLYYSFLDDYSFLVKKLHHKTISISFL